MFWRNSLRSRWKSFAILLVLVFTSILLINQVHLFKPLRMIKVKLINPIQCFRNEPNLATLPEVLDDDPPPGKSVFFLETSCKSMENARVSITPRQACAVESAALLNPNFNVYLMYASPGALKLENNRNDKILQQLMSYKNIRLKYINFERYIEGSPVEVLYKNFMIESSSFAVSHASDVLRYLTLWRYGGIYLDLDVVLLRSFEDVEPNFAGSESKTSVAAGVLSFGHDGRGHKWARQALEDLKINFNGNHWGNNGPGVITRYLLCCESAQKVVFFFSALVKKWSKSSKN